MDGGACRRRHGETLRSGPFPAGKVNYVGVAEYSRSPSELIDLRRAGRGHALDELSGPGQSLLTERV
ncbi:MAG: hypothetical protein GEV04_19110 [Actinophytocola sp.]|nr:hypothetical protein [Actinophytocola sp.]